MIFLSLGTNLGDRKANLVNAIAAMWPSIRVLQESPVYETAPWGYEEQPSFLNQIIQGETVLPPLDLLHSLKKLETELGREPSFRYGPRLIDMDILFYDDLVFRTPELTIPHPHLHKRAFVLVPMADIAPDFVHPVMQKNIQQLLDHLSHEDIQSVMKVA